MVYIAFTSADTMGKLSQLPFWVVESRESSHDLDGGNAFAGQVIHCKNGNNTSWMINI